MQNRIEIIRSDRRSVAVEIRRDLSVAIRVPRSMNDADIRKFIIDKTPWIEKHLELMREKLADEAKKSPVRAFTDEEIEALADEAFRVIPEGVRVFAKMIGVTYGRITIRNQVSRWGSCSSKGNLNFNCLLMLCPEPVRDYVIIHELCHLKYMDHSKDFWSEVKKYCPDAKEHELWLKENGRELIERMRGARLK